MQQQRCNIFLVGDTSPISGQAHQVQQNNNLFLCLSDLTINSLPGDSSHSCYLQVCHPTIQMIYDQISGILHQTNKGPRSICFMETSVFLDEAVEPIAHSRAGQKINCPHPALACLVRKINLFR